MTSSRASPFAWRTAGPSARRCRVGPGRKPPSDFLFGPKGQPFVQRRAQPWEKKAALRFPFRPEGPAVHPAKGAALGESRPQIALSARRASRSSSEGRSPGTSADRQLYLFVVFQCSAQRAKSSPFKEDYHATIARANLVAHHLQHRGTSGIPPKPGCPRRDVPDVKSSCPRGRTVRRLDRADG